MNALNIISDLKGRLLYNVPAMHYTTMRINGTIYALYIPDTIKDLMECLEICKENKIKVHVLGNGSNIIISDKCGKRLFIKLSSQFFQKIEVCSDSVICGAGALLNRLCNVSEAASLAGAEFLVGIPGTIGGGIIQNAGAHNISISDILHECSCIDKNGKIRIIEAGNISFDYRKSDLKGFIVIGAVFKLKKERRSRIRANIKNFMEKRLQSQDYSKPSAGCVFKNPKAGNRTAGALIDDCGLKGVRIGDASISEKHANFIINRGKATAEDIISLMALIKKRVKKKHGITLEEEVEIIK